MPLLVVFVVAVVAVGLMLIQVGRATTLSAEAQTAADAAALAGGNEVANQLKGIYNSSGGVDEAAVRAAAADYAERNGAELTELKISNLDVLVRVRTIDALDEGAREVGSEGERGLAQARARISIALPAGGGGIPTGNLDGSVKDAIRLGTSLGLQVTSTLRPGDTGSLHSLGIAADLAGPPAAMAAFYKAALQRYSYIEELFYDPLGGVDKNIQIGTIGGHSDHVHIALTGNSIGPKAEDAPKGKDFESDPGGSFKPLAATAAEVMLVPYEG